MNLFFFECKKLLKRKTTWFAFLLSAGAVIALYFFNLTIAMQIHEENIMAVEQRLQFYPEVISEIELDKEAAENNEDMDLVNDLNLMIEGYQQRMKETEELIEAYRKEDWERILSEQINGLEELIVNTDSYFAGGSYIEDELIPWFTIRATLNEKQLLAENDVVPFVQKDINDDFIPTIYEQFTGKALEQWETQTKRYATTGFSFLYQLIQSWFIPVMVLIGCFIFGNTISSEMGTKKRGIQFYKVLPLNRNQLFLAKYLSGIAFTLLFVFSMSIIPLLCSLFTKGIGSLDYPVLVYEGSEPSTYGSEYRTLDPMNDLFHFISLSDYLGKTLLLTTGLVLAFYSIYYFLSLFIKSPGLTVFLLASIGFVGMTILPVSPYNPFIYIDIDKILTFETATTAFNPSIHFQNGMITLYLLGVMMAVLGLFWFRKVRSS